MEALSVRDYRNNLAASFDRAHRGEPVLIRRRGQLFALTSIGSEDLTISSKLKKRIEEARESYRKGDYISCKTPKELTDFLDSL